MRLWSIPGVVSWIVLLAIAPASAEDWELLPKQIPVPAIETAVGSMPGIDALPLRTEMPDPLSIVGRERITTPEQWEARREEIKKIMSYYAVGAMPPAPGNVRGVNLKSQSLSDGKVDYRLVHLSFGPEQAFGFDVAIFTPADQPGPFPTVIFPSFAETPGAEVLPLMPRLPQQGHGLDSLRLPLGIPETSEPAPQGRGGTPAETVEKYSEVFRRGYALVTYNYQDTGEDTIARNEDGSWAFRNTRYYPAYPNYDWGLLGGWAWGISRVVDYLEGQDSVDQEAIIATGHSRLGKTVLVAGAFDERIAISAPAGSAGGGVGAYRFSGKGRFGGEGLDDMERKYPNWFSPNLHPFADEPEKLPFDQHWFIALTAPRRFITLQGTGDHINSPMAIRQSLLGAMPVYELYGAADRVGSNYCEQGHVYSDCDWRALLDFSDQQLRGKHVGRTFNELPPEAHAPKRSR